MRNFIRIVHRKKSFVSRSEFFFHIFVSNLCKNGRSRQKSVRRWSWNDQGKSLKFFISLRVVESRNRYILSILNAMIHLGFMVLREGKQIITLPTI